MKRRLSCAALLNEPFRTDGRKCCHSNIHGYDSSVHDSSPTRTCIRELAVPTVSIFGSWMQDEMTESRSTMRESTPETCWNLQPRPCSARWGARICVSQMEGTRTPALAGLALRRGASAAAGAT